MGQNQGMEVRMVLFTIIPSDTSKKCLLLVLAILRSAGLQVLIPGGGVLLPGYTRKIPLTWKLRIPRIRGVFDAIMPIG